MAEERFDAVVLKESPFGENGKRLVVLAKDLGKITVSAKGAKVQKAGFPHPHSFFPTVLLCRSKPKFLQHGFGRDNRVLLCRKK